MYSVHDVLILPATPTRQIHCDFCVCLFVSVSIQPTAHVQLHVRCYHGHHRVRGGVSDGNYMYM